uniref:Uncharacterized protein n=1 Tax=Lepeophtheirus salmonis TaxID=72036 RepID=A0A0K2UYL2_LEPSM
MSSRLQLLPHTTSIEKFISSSIPVDNFKHIYNFF